MLIFTYLTQNIIENSLADMSEKVYVKEYHFLDFSNQFVKIVRKDFRKCNPKIKFQLFWGNFDFFAEI